MANVNEGNLLQLRVPLPPPDVQRDLVEEARTIFERIETMQAECQRQQKLLSEHRQALIIAAVTGQLDLTRSAA